MKYEVLYTRISLNGNKTQHSVIADNREELVDVLEFIESEENYRLNKVNKIFNWRGIKMRYPNVIEVVKKMNLEMFDKFYKDVNGRWHNTDTPLADLGNTFVKDVYINFPMEQATFTIIVNK